MGREEVERENYLEAIVVLKREKGHVRSIDIANHLELSRPSVSKAMKKLEELGHIVMESDGEIVLLESGERIGREIDERHQILYRLLVKLGVSEENAENDACKIEHALSQETFDRLKQVFGED